MSIRYTPEQKALLCSLYPTKSTEEIIDIFYNRYGETLTRSAIKAFATNHKLKKLDGHLTAEEIAFIQDNGAGRNTEELTALFNARFNKKKDDKSHVGAAVQIRCKKRIKDEGTKLGAVP